jgi:hypothetical protein
MIKNISYLNLGVKTEKVEDNFRFNELMPMPLGKKFN